MENTSKDQFELTSSLKSICITAIIVGLVALLASFKLDPHVGWVDFLTNSLFVITISVSGLFLLSISGVMQASWLTPMKRIPEAMTKFLPIGFVFMLIVYLGRHTIYEWTHMDIVKNDPILSGKTGYLNEPFFLIRMIAIFAIWITCSTLHRKYSRVMDEKGWTPELTKKITRVSAISLVLFAASFSFASFDWLMSIEPHWFSTMFAVYHFAGTFVSGFAFMTLAVLFLQKHGYLKEITDHNLHDLGKWMFGFSVFWAYIWICQYLLIWYGNIPEETEYFVLRSHVLGNGVVFGNVIINWTIPFLLLMTRESKRNKKVLAFTATLLLLGHFFDLYQMVAPKIFEHSHAQISGFGVLQLLQVIGFFALLVLVAAKALSKNKLVSKNDPTYVEGVHLHQ